jgi:hypothetical protein
MRREKPWLSILTQSVADEQTKALKRSLSTEQAYYLNPSEIA